MRLRSILDFVADHLGYEPKISDALKIAGHVFAEYRDADGVLVREQYLGKNTVTQAQRIYVAGLLARTSAEVPGAVSFDFDEGYTATEPVFPLELGVGIGTTAALPIDTDLEDPLLIGASPARYALTRIFFSRTVLGYGTDPIGVSFFFDIPAGESYTTYGTSVDYQEFAMFAPGAPDVMLARKVIRLEKISPLALTIRWEFRT